MSSNPYEFNVNEVMARVATLSIDRTASSIYSTLKSLKAEKDSKKTIRVMEEIIDELLNDKRELIGITKSYEEKFVSQKITKDELNKITEDIIPALTSFISDSEEEDESKKEESIKMIESITPLLSTEVLDILQTIGFNYKEALGKPLTEISKNAVLSISSQTSDKDLIKLQTVRQEYEVAFQRTLQDEDSYNRMLDWVKRNEDKNDY